MEGKMNTKWDARRVLLTGTSGKMGEVFKRFPGSPKTTLRGSNIRNGSFSM